MLEKETECDSSFVSVYRNLSTFYNVLSHFQTIKASKDILDFKVFPK